jgi:hypothetical protein
MYDNPYEAPKSEIFSSVQPVSDRLDDHFAGIQWPLRMRFRFWALTSKMDIEDAAGRPVLHVKQKFFKLREHIELFTDQTRSVKLGDIKADRIIDWSARYSFVDAWGGAIGAVGRKGWRSLWKANYQSYNPGDAVPDYTITEENPFAKLVDGLVGQIPLVGLLTLYFFHPRYSAKRLDGGPVMRLTKLPAFLEGRFQVDLLQPLPPREQLNLLLSFFMLAMLERRRG